MSKTKKSTLFVLLLALMLAAIAAISVSAMPTQTAYANTEYTPLTESVTTLESGKTYSISSEAELDRLATLVNSGQTGTGATFVLTDNITYMGENNYTPIGTIIETSNYPFKGTFDGQSHTVSGININAESLSYGGLFGFIDFATVKNVGVVNSTITITNSTAVGAIVGRADSSTIENCYNTSALTTETSYIGGIVGLGYNLNIKGCYNTGSITLNGNNSGSYAGGIAGSIKSLDVAASLGNTVIEKCYNTGSITATATQAETSSFRGVAGIVANYQNVKLQSSQKKDMSIYTCYNAGTISSSCQGDFIAGIVAYAYVNYADFNTITVYNCHNHGTITSTYSSIVNESNMCGIICQSSGVAANIRFANCYAKGAKTSDINSGASATMTEAQFTSGQVANALQQFIDSNYSSRGQIWGQKLSSVSYQHENYPRFSTDKVYYGYATCTAQEETYTNNPVPVHNWSITGHNTSEVTLTCSNCNKWFKVAAPSDLIYNGSAKEAVLTTSQDGQSDYDDFCKHLVGIAYETASGTPLSSAPVDVGDYKVIITLQNEAATAIMSYSIEPREVESISIPASYQTQTYKVGQAEREFDITITYNNGQTDTVSSTDASVTWSDFDTSAVTTEAQTATLTYENKTATFSYTVIIGYEASFGGGEGLGISGTMSSQYADEGDSITLPENTIKKAGYTFVNWLCSYDSQSYAAGASYQMPAQDVTFTAQWKLNAPTLSCAQAVDNNGSKEVTLTYNGNEQSITVTAAHDLGNAVSYTYQWWTGTINLGDKGTNAWISVTNVSESNRYICVVTATYGTDKSSALYSVTVTVNPAEQAELTFSQTAITYAGSDINLSQYVSGGSGDGTITFSKVSSSNITHGTFGTNGIIQNITKAGGTFTFKVKKAASSDGNYKAAEKEFTLTINKGVQNIVIGDISSPTFGSSYDLTASGNVGTVTFEIITGGTATGKIENGKLSISDRGADGTVMVKAIAAETDLYAQGTAQKTFTFAKASYDSAPEFSGNIPAQTYTLCVGRALSEITLPTYWSWQDGQSLPNQTGTYDRTAIFTPASPDNYEGTEATISITVAAHNTEGAATSNNDGTHSHTCSVCFATIIENCTYGDWVTTVQPGVNQEGSKYRVCTECGYRDTQVIPATHTCVYDNEFTVDIAPTCTTAGEKSRHCTTAGCEHRTDITEIPALGHSWGDWTVRTEPTLQTAGELERVCANDSSHTDSFVLPALNDSDYVYIVVTAPGCETAGEGKYSYTKDNKTFDFTVTLQATGHTLTRHAAKAATCTEDGNIAYWTCNVCNKYFSDENGESEISLNDIVLQATGHNYSDEWKSDVSGHWHECSCGDKADVSAHTPGAAATETTPQTCTTCGYVITLATGHVTHTPDTSKWYSDGTNHWHKCVGCEEKLDVAQHSGDTATCEHKAVCEICGAEYGELAAHSYGKWTYYSDTQHRRVCSVNASHVEYDDHAWNDGEITTAPTHTATGVKTYTCADCGHTKTEIVPVTAEHTYDREVAEARYLKSAATCTQKAVYYKSCACGERGTATFEYGGYAAHTLTAHEAVAATCTQNGNIAYWSCSVCNKYFSDSTGETEITQVQTVIAAGHNYEFTRTVAPNLEEQTDGYDLWTCTRDENHTERRNIVEWETLIADTVTVTVSGGTIQGQSGSSITVNKNGNVTVVADEIEGKTFVGWRNANGDIVSENATYTFRASADMTLTAVYEDVTPEPDGLSGGAIAGIVVGSVAVAGIGGFALFWIVIKKKSLADLLAVFKRK